jgi:hypothetical protein
MDYNESTLKDSTGEPGEMMKLLMTICWGVFAALVGFFIVVVTPMGELIHLQGDLSNYVVPLGSLGTILTILMVITRMNLALKCFLLVTGISAASWPLILFLHDMLFPFFPTEPFTYILLFFICIPAFIIGAIGAIILGVRQLFFSKRITAQKSGG